MSENVLITGITGSGGSYLAEYILENHPNVNVFGMCRWHSTTTYDNINNIKDKMEIQPGSFAFMDNEYGMIGGPGGTEYRDFAQALTVVATVISRRPGVAIVDAGYKAFATDRPFTPVPLNLPGVTYAWAGDEHGRPWT